ncbi:hypothetical protein F4604DRAFT_1918585 [Suillus subluteus]|nr:hypothetical protein F4604DRAFT_1918585 [Suillus subluteus]
MRGRSSAGAKRRRFGATVLPARPFARHAATFGGTLRRASLPKRWVHAGAVVAAAVRASSAADYSVGGCEGRGQSAVRLALLKRPSHSAHSQTSDSEAKTWSFRLRREEYGRCYMGVQALSKRFAVSEQYSPGSMYLDEFRWAEYSCHYGTTFRLAILRFISYLLDPASSLW